MLIIILDLMVETIQVRQLMGVIAISIANGAQMVSPQLWVIPRSSGKLGILCKGFNIVVVWRLDLLTTSLSLIITFIPTSLIPSIPLLVIHGDLVREVLLCIEISSRSGRIQGRGQGRLHRRCVVE